METAKKDGLETQKPSGKGITRQIQDREELSKEI